MLTFQCIEPAEPIEQQPRKTMAHTLPPRRKCQTLQRCINRRSDFERERGQEPPPRGHTDGKVSHSPPLGAPMLSVSLYGSR